MSQKIISPENNYAGLDSWLNENKIRKLFLVCDGSIRFLTGISNKILKLEADGLRIVRFSDFEPNPLYESVVAGVGLFRKENCDGIMAVGGGSAMDVAKCIKLYSNMDSDGADGAFLTIRILSNDIPFLAVPTTAGTGSEATKYAVIYYGGKKQSVTSDSCIPGTVLLDPGTLTTLPVYQKKATMADALCHAVESFWSVNSTEESMRYSENALRGILDNMAGYLANDPKGNEGMMTAAHYAGMAINISQTTAGHAMCYKITSLFGVAHGHAAVLCDRVLFPDMIANVGNCIDPRGQDHLKKTLDNIGTAMGCEGAADGAQKFAEIFDRLGLGIPEASKGDLEELRTSVNPVRLKNHPVKLDDVSIDRLYRLIFREKP
ncbi:MAG: phosphonoacetaldehyde reductase [Clostridiales bacterium]|nr:phosphonoacetaldehyde reductase [Clostridiales bacterium]